MSVVDMIGYLGAVLVALTFYMKTMVPLRVIGICSNCAFIAYGYLNGLYPVLILHCILLPLNSLRLREMLQLMRKVRGATQGNLNMDWLKPFMSKRAIKAGDILFRKSDKADHLYFLVAGRLHLNEIGIDLLPGSVVGELGMLAPARVRTQTLECTESGTLLEISYDKIEELYYQNPTFGFYFLRLSSARLFENIDKLERTLAERDQEILRVREGIVR
jgi:CRP/FNR family cyclic AMP-dependent transcriptional regulator